MKKVATMSDGAAEDLPLTTSEAARLLDRSPDTVRHLNRTGRLGAIRTAGAHGMRLFRRADVLRLLEERNQR
jgi:excisionase family DNA binding protein